ncbi:MAG: AAA family ATPase [Lachnospiraceae bacterium]|nr:AAA family ATPase [Lachnospiraceae bacterium]
MRYYRFALKTTVSYIEANSKVRLKDYSYDNTICAVNNYIYKKVQNGITFFIYREDGKQLLSSFSYDEKRDSYMNSLNTILGIMRDAFCIRIHCISEREEITMNDFLENLLESKRRDYLSGVLRIRDISDLWIYDAAYADDWKNVHFDLDEKIISDRKPVSREIYDSGLIQELEEIGTHPNTSGYVGNLCHYIVSARSLEATADMTECLMQKLLQANRLTSRRMEIIRNISKDLYKYRTNYIEKTIENNDGGVIVIDLTERFGEDPVEYTMNSRYLEKMFKTYRNECLFVFTYNIDNPGFAFQILPKLNRYVRTVAIKEGTGDRKAAVSYLKDLIGKSEYAKYAGQASEFLKLFPGDSFTQTDVLQAYDKFEPWCLGKNVFHVPFDINDEFMLDRDENAGSCYDRLQKLIGLGIVKKKTDEIIAANLVAIERKKRLGNKNQGSCMHMIFSGNPGSAKTTVAKLFAGIAKEKGILKSGAFVERGGMDLDGLGCVYAIREAFEAAKGGVLFIDEAYSLKSDVAVTTLIQEMENKREEVIVILAGYEDRMNEFMERNEGLKSRIPYTVEFPDYTGEELTEIFKLMLKEKNFSATDKAIGKAEELFSKVCYIDNFGNGRYVRNLIENAVKKQSVRLLSNGKDTNKIRKKDLFLLTEEDICSLEDGLISEREKGSAEKELDELIGLTRAKDVIHKAIAGFKMDKICREHGISKDKSSCHMVFTGNPGTAKTTVARLFAEILKDEKILPAGKFVEVGRADIVGEFVGKTAPLVKKKFKEAQGGVLFIDEAYSLSDGQTGGYGDEAINTIVQEMENNRDKVIVIFAGYPKPMKEFLERNPGMSSRIAFHVEFDDYSSDELCEITKLMVSKKQYEITDAAMDRVRSLYEKVRNDSEFGNGRFVRKILEEAEMNLAMRIGKMNPSEITTKLLTTIEAEDIPATPKTERKAGVIRIGFSG